MKAIPTLTLLVATISVFCVFMARQDFAEDGNASPVTGTQLQESIVSYDNHEFGPIKIIFKAWNETYDARSRLDISFYGRFADLPDPRSHFLQIIKIFDEKKEIQVHDWDAADCSLEKIMLIAKGPSTYLVLADRSWKDNSTEISSQSAPAPQVLKLFKLTEVGTTKDKNEYGQSHAFLQRIVKRKTAQSFCRVDDIYQSMQSFAGEAVL